MCRRRGIDNGMTRKEAFTILEMKEGASLESIKQVYRRLAFALHPDLNPGVPQGAKAFQRLNEAYVLLSQAAKTSPGAAKAGESAGARQKAREEAGRAYQKASAGQRAAGNGQRASEKAEQPDAGTAGGRCKEDVLADILNDPFAKRVFEDIYRHIQAEHKDKPSSSRAAPASKKVGSSTKSVHIKKSGGPVKGNGFVGSIKGWFRKQIDEEQVLFLPGASLMPGARVRLDIRHGLGGEVQTVEIVLPPDFVPGKLVRLRGMGKRVGNWCGDLYVRIEAQ